MNLFALTIPLVAWVIGGSVKFLMNSVRARRFAFDLIGYGGMPSNHATIVTAPLVYVFLRNGATEVVLLGLTLAFVVCMDAMGLRKHVARQAKEINSLRRVLKLDSPEVRERFAHTPTEIMAGIVLGACVGAAFYGFLDK